MLLSGSVLNHFSFQVAAPHLRNGSSVVFISSIAGYQPEVPLAMYGVTKTALFGLTKVVSWNSLLLLLHLLFSDSHGFVLVERIQLYNCAYVVESRKFL